MKKYCCKIPFDINGLPQTRIYKVKMQKAQSSSNKASQLGAE